MCAELAINKSIKIKSEPSAVWDALTNPVMISQYFSGAETISDWQIGSEILFIHHYNGEIFTNKGVILDVVPNLLLRYTYWTIFSETEDKPENYTAITFSLSHSDGITNLALTQTNLKNVKWYAGLQKGLDEVLAKIKELKENGNKL